MSGSQLAPLIGEACSVLVLFQVTDLVWFPSVCVYHYLRVCYINSTSFFCGSKVHRKVKNRTKRKSLSVWQTPSRPSAWQASCWECGVLSLLLGVCVCVSVDLVISWCFEVWWKHRPQGQRVSFLQSCTPSVITTDGHGCVRSTFTLWESKE